MTGSAYAMSRSLDVKGKALLTTWLCNQRRAGIEYPRITTDTISRLKTLSPLTTAERVERALLYFNQHVRVGSAIELDAGDSPDDTVALVLMALTESLSKGELIALLQMIESMSLLTDKTQRMGTYEFTPTATGWLKIDELITRLPSTAQAFVAMWFNDATLAAYADGIEPAITDAGYRAVRIDKKEHNNKIDDEIIAEIRRSKFLVADFTCEKEKVRGGVYFEAGLRFSRSRALSIFWLRRARTSGWSP
jgi:hypothetical protein